MNLRVLSSPLPPNQITRISKPLTVKILDRYLKILNQNTFKKDISSDYLLSRNLTKVNCDQEDPLIDPKDLQFKNILQPLWLRINRSCDRGGIESRKASSDASRDVDHLTSNLTFTAEKQISDLSSLILNSISRCVFRSDARLCSNTPQTIEVQGGFAVHSPQHFFLQVENRNTLLVVAANQASRNWWFREQKALSLALKQAGYQKILYYHQFDDSAY